MNTTLWIGLSLLITTCLGISSGLATNLVWLNVEKKPRAIYIALIVNLALALIFAIIPTQGALFHSKRWNLIPNQTLYVTTGGFQYNGYKCGGDPKKLCVFLFTSSVSQSITINDLPLQVNLDSSEQPLFYDAIREIDPNQIWKEQETSFWDAPNCQTGCERATIYTFRDGALDQQIERTKP